MEKSKLGIPVTLVAAAAWLFGLYNGYLLTAILVGYVLLAEESVWLKKTCLKVQKLFTLLLMTVRPATHSRSLIFLTDMVAAQHSLL